MTYKGETQFIELLDNGNMSLEALQGFFPDATALKYDDDRGSHGVAINHNKEILIDKRYDTKFIVVSTETGAQTTKNQIHKLGEAHKNRVKSLVADLQANGFKRKINEPSIAVLKASTSCEGKTQYGQPEKDLRKSQPVKLFLI